MAEIKGQLLGVLLVLAVFGAALTAGVSIMTKTGAKVTEEIESFDPNASESDSGLLSYYGN